MSGHALCPPRAPHTAMHPDTGQTCQSTAPTTSQTGLILHKQLKTLALFGRGGRVAPVAIYGMDCLTDEYYQSGKCHKCPQCPPGQELKEVWQLRVVSVMFGGLRKIGVLSHVHFARTAADSTDTKSSPAHAQTMRYAETASLGGEVTGVAKVQTLAPAFQTVSSIITACAATAILTTVLLAIVCVTYQARSSLRKKCKRCLSPVSDSQRDSDAASVPMNAPHTVMQDTQVDRSDYWPLLRIRPTLEDSMVTTSSDLHSHQCKVVPPLCNSACPDPGSVFIRQVTETDSSTSSQHVILTLLEGQEAVRHCCAVEQPTSWGLHSPVECTELDLQHLSGALGNLVLQT
ncbi:hypothetical protein DNTS_013741 [Danionella cerebrum]|uniref:TNFR-Cys domain-containing protein n=1 Tax=Danionella cerebrum TaxID=2873325 RepID=A0A553R221_9TELE|nr:hypothetical protein DNTS_013741 [Danionella translucida]TRY96220.1 hypothetical protein DNTS_013741 [Danionella translucida]